MNVGGFINGGFFFSDFMSVSSKNGESGLLSAIMMLLSCAHTPAGVVVGMELWLYNLLMLMMMRIASLRFVIVSAIQDLFLFTLNTLRH